ncbi:unnamed protein product, partial [Chrysoparadoxa australica]
MVTPYRKECLERLSLDLTSTTREVQSNSPPVAIKGLVAFLESLGVDSVKGLQEKAAATSQEDLLQEMLVAAETHLGTAMLYIEQFVELVLQISPRHYPNRLMFDLTPTMVASLADELVTRITLCLDGIAALAPEKCTFESCVQPMSDCAMAITPLHRSIGFLKDVSDDKALREASSKAETMMSQYYVEAGMRMDVYKSIMAFSRTDEASELQGEKKRLLEKHVRDLRRRGLGLDADKRNRISEVKKEMVKLGIEFQKNLGDEATTLLFSREELDGLPTAKIDSFEV